MAVQAYHGQVVTITGGANGIGLALARKLRALGAKIVIADIDTTKGEFAARELGGPDAAVFSRTDVANAQEQQALVDFTIERFGRLDLFVNNAGIEISGEVRDLDIAHWQRAIEINLSGVIYGTVAAYKAMIAAGHGHIVNIASGAGLIMFPTSIPYTTAKAGVVGLTRALRAEAAAYDIRVTLVCPGMVDTNIWQAAQSIGPDIAKFAQFLPGRTVSAERAAQYILAGFAKRTPEIVFPPENALGAWLVNAIPPFGSQLRKVLVERFRKMEKN